MKKIEVVASLEVALNYNFKGKLAVIIDVFRATTTMVTAMANGVKEVKTCLETSKAIALKEQGYLVGGERDGIKLPAMDVDNSPLSFLNENYANKKLAISTTNGTKAVEMSLDAKEIIIGSFVNLKAVCTYINQSNLDVWLVCAGWKGKMCLEDFLFAGTVVHHLKNKFVLNDSSEVALGYYLSCKHSYKETLGTCEHAIRLQNLGKQEDVSFCIQEDVYNIVPKYQDELKTFTLS